MKVVRCSASAIGTYTHCPFSYYLHYILGMETRAGKAALQGTITHKVLEIMGKRTKRGKGEIDPMMLLDHVWDRLTAKSPEIAIRRVTTRIDKETGGFKEAADFKKCRVALEAILANPYYNPYNLNILDCERWFAIELPGEEWECVDQEGKSHQFTVRGFLDLVHEIDQDTLEIVDWKTGKRTSFYSQEEIDEEVLMREVQPRLYHLAAYFLYPKYKNIIITFYYANSGGPVTISLSNDDLVHTITFLHRFLTTITKDTLIRRNKSWKCKMCSLSKGDICTKVWSDLFTCGGEYVESRYRGLSCQDQLAIGKTGEV